jgi:hypothetical protein
VLAFPLIHVQPDGVPVRARELRVDVDERLNPVFARRNVAQALHRMPERLRVDRRYRARCELVDVDAEERHARFTGLLNGCAIGVARLADGDVHATGDRLGVCGLRERDLEAW